MGGLISVYRLYTSLSFDQKDGSPGLRTAHRGQPGLGDKIEFAKDDWILGFDGLSIDDPSRNSWRVKKDGGHFDQFTGATITPRAVVKSVRTGLEFFDFKKHVLLQVFVTDSMSLPTQQDDVADEVVDGS